MRNPIHRNRRRKLCGRKKKYLSRESASADMGLLAQSTGTTGLTVYRCKDCGEFHVGHARADMRRLLDRCNRCGESKKELVEVRLCVDCVDAL